MSALRLGTKRRRGHARPGDARVAELREGMLAQVGTALFSGSGRDVESLGLGVVEPEPGSASAPVDLLPDEIAREVVLGALRVLGLSRFYAPGARPDRDPEQQSSESAARLAEGRRGAMGSRPRLAKELGRRSSSARRSGLPALGGPARALSDL